ncbi:MAG: ABC transporter substrate-binding protein [Chloroflexaceae bacterium]|nr:ABC transporter substrate-binding protein [Chloroflexaceae bacterium]
MNTSYRLSIGLVLLCLCMVIVAACGGSPAAPAPAAPAAESEEPEAADTAASGALETTDVSIRLSWVPQWQFAGYIAAEVNGYYDEAGLNVTINGGGPEFPEIQMVASEADTFGTQWPDTIMIARENDVDLVMLATFFQTSPTAYMVHADSGIASPEDFIDKSVAVFYGSGLETEYRGMLAEVGVDASTITEVPGEFTLEPFLSRRVDVWPVYATDQPNTVRNQGVDINLLFARDYGVTMIGDGLFATRAFVEANPRTTEAFVHASLRGWNWAAENPEEAVALIHEYNPEIAVEQLTFEAQETIPLLRYGAGETCIGWNDMAAWDAEHEMLVNLGTLQGEATVADSMTNEFVESY